MIEKWRNSGHIADGRKEKSKYEKLKFLGKSLTERKGPYFGSEYETELKT